MLHLIDLLLLIQSQSSPSRLDTSLLRQERTKHLLSPPPATYSLPQMSEGILQSPLPAQTAAGSQRLKQLPCRTPTARVAPVTDALHAGLPSQAQNPARSPPFAD